MLFYLPVLDQQLLTFATNWNANRAGLRTNDAGSAVLVHGQGNRPLSVVGRKDTLFLLCHGSAKSPDRIGAQTGTRKTLFGTKAVYEMLTAAECADRMVTDGLTNELGDLRLMVCWAGMGRKGKNVPFAGQLCAALKQRGFFRIIVTGYTGAVQMSEHSYNLLIAPGINRTTHNTRQAAVVDSRRAGYQQEGLANTGSPNTTFEDMFNKAVEDAQGQGGKSFSLSDEFRTVWY